jgi:hypothetical protein
MFDLKTETDSSLRNIVFWKINRSFLDKDKTMDNVQKHNIYTHVPSPQTLRSYLLPLFGISGGRGGTGADFLRILPFPLMILIPLNPIYPPQLVQRAIYILRAKVFNLTHTKIIIKSFSLHNVLSFPLREVHVDHLLSGSVPATRFSS